MKLIKISTEHYVVVDETIQPVNGYYYDSFIKAIRNTSAAEYGEANHCWQITHSTQPMPHGTVREGQITGVTAISLQEVKELIVEVDVEKKAEKMFPGTYIVIEGLDIAPAHREGFVTGYTQALEDNKDKKYTEEDVISIVEKSRETGLTAEYLMLTLQPKTEWEVEIVDGKLKLKL